MNGTTNGLATVIMLKQLGAANWAQTAQERQRKAEQEAIRNELLKGAKQTQQLETQKREKPASIPKQLQKQHNIQQPSAAPRMGGKGR